MATIKRMSKAGYKIVAALEVGDTFQSKYGTGFINRMESNGYIRFVRWADGRALLAEWRLTPTGYVAAREHERAAESKQSEVDALKAEITALRARIAELEAEYGR